MCATGQPHSRGPPVKLVPEASLYYSRAAVGLPAAAVTAASSGPKPSTFDRSDNARRELNPYAAMAAAPLATQPMAMLLVRHAFEARHADEATLYQGDVVQGFRRTAGWWLGRSRDRIGIFPDNYVVAWEQRGAPASSLAQFSAPAARSPALLSGDRAALRQIGDPGTATGPGPAGAYVRHTAADNSDPVFDGAWLEKFTERLDDVGGWIEEHRAAVPAPYVPIDAPQPSPQLLPPTEGYYSGDLSGLNDRGVPLTVMRALAEVESQPITPEAAQLLQDYAAASGKEYVPPVAKPKPAVPPAAAPVAAAPAKAKEESAFTVMVASAEAPAPAPAPITPATPVSAPAPALASPAPKPGRSPVKRTAEQLEELQASFSMFDTDGGGTVDAAELKEVLSKVGIEVTPAELTSAMAEVDTSGDGALDFQEFLQMMDDIETGKASKLGALMKKARNLNRGAVVGEPIAIDDAKALFAAGATVSAAPDAVEDVVCVMRALMASYLTDGLAEETVAFIANTAERVELAGGAALYAEGDTADDGFAVARGELLVGATNRSGAGTLVGEGALAMPGKYEETVKNANTSAACVVYKIPRSMFKLAVAGAADLAAERAEAALRTVQQFVDELSSDELVQLVPLIERVKLDAGGSIEGDALCFVSKGELDGAVEGESVGLDAALGLGDGDAKLTAGAAGVDCLVLRRDAVKGKFGELGERLDRNVAIKAVNYVTALEDVGTKFQHRVVGKEIGLVALAARVTLAAGEAFDATQALAIVMAGTLKGGEGGGGVVNRIGTVGEHLLAALGRGVAAKEAKEDPPTFPWAAGAEGATVLSFPNDVLVKYVADMDSAHSSRLRAACRRTKRTMLMGRALGEKACAEKIAEKNGSVASMVVSDPDQIERLRTLGMGSFGRVFLARLKAGDASNVFALKALQKGAVVEMQQQKNVVVEKSVMAECEHPFVVKLVASYQDPICLFMGMPVVRGGEVAHRLAKATKLDEDGDEEPIGIDPLDAAFYTVCVALGTAHMHSKGFIWRDLKPENVLIDEKGYAKCVDFGLSKRLDFANGKDKTYTMCGTPE